MSRRAYSSPATSTRFRIEAPQVSWLGDSLRLLSRFRKSNRSSGAAFPLRPESRDSELRTVARAENFRLTVARRRRLSTVFPCAESLVIVDGAANHSAPLAKANHPPPRCSKDSLVPTTTPSSSWAFLRSFCHPACPEERRERSEGSQLPQWLRLPLMAPPQNHPRPPRNSQLHLKRRLENFLQQISLIHLRRRPDPQRLALLQQHDPIRKLRRQI